MIYTDKVYGKYKISEPVILDLINSTAIQRLKYVNQDGYPPLFVKLPIKTGKYQNSRYAHSIGVYLLLRKYNASLEEQIAGLIHDVSHAAFSHCIDYVLNTGSEKEHTHQDNHFEEFVKKTQIPKILNRYGIKLESILDDKNFPLKEKKLPDLCADRIDYSLRDSLIFQEISKDQIRNFLSNLVATENNEWVFKNSTVALEYAKLFRKYNRIYLSGIASAIMFRAVGDCLKYALKKHYINYHDLYTTDNLVLQKIKTAVEKDAELKLYWQRMNGKIKAKNSPNDYDARVFCKSRIVDPLYINKGEIKRISQQYPKWKMVVEKESAPKEYFIKFDK